MKYLIVPLKAPPLYVILNFLCHPREQLWGQMWPRWPWRVSWNGKKERWVVFVFRMNTCFVVMKRILDPARQWKSSPAMCPHLEVCHLMVQAPYLYCVWRLAMVAWFFFFFLITGRCRKVLLVRVKTTVQYVLANKSAHKTIKGILQFCGLLQL